MINNIMQHDSMPLIISLVISFAIALLHYQALSFLTYKITHAENLKRARVLIIMCIITITHLISVFIYAFVYFAMDNHFNMGSLAGQEIKNFYDYIYYSLIVYTSLGFGDIYPTGGLRILSGLETLNGLILIAWSATYSYLAMSKYWMFEDTKKIEDK